MLIEIIRAASGGVFIAAGLALVFGSAIGVLRFPDFYTRLHAARVGDGLGSALILIGLACVASDLAMALRLLFLAALGAALAPILSHLAANGAHAGGLAPLAGPYVAPRPGARREQP